MGALTAADIRSAVADIVAGVSCVSLFELKGIASPTQLAPNTQKHLGFIVSAPATLSTGATRGRQLEIVNTSADVLLSYRVPPARNGAQLSAFDDLAGPIETEIIARVSGRHDCDMTARYVGSDREITPEWITLTVSFEVQHCIDLVCPT